MATDLVLPSPTALGMVPPHERSLAQQLRSSWNVQLRTRWNQGPKGPCLETLTVSEGLPPEAYRGALEALASAEQARADQKALARGLAMLTAVCVRPADFDDAKIILWSDRLRDVLSEYPADVALGAIDQWPRTDNGKFWPSENEFRELLDFMGHFRRDLRWKLELALRDALPKAPPPPPRTDGLSDDPTGDVERFVKRWHGFEPDRASIYLHGARYGEGVIATESMLSQMVIEQAVARHSEAQIRVVGVAARIEGGGVEWAL